MLDLVPYLLVGVELLDGREGDPLRENAFGDFVPKFIDWLDTVHPATTSVRGCRFESFEIGHPEAAALNALLGELGADLVAERASQPCLRLRMQTPQGRVSFVG